MAIKYEVPVFVICRAPKDAVSSLLLKKSVEDQFEKYLPIYLEDYISYHDFILKHVEEVEIMKFSDLIENPESFLMKVASLLEISANAGQIKSSVTSVYDHLNKMEESRSDSVSSLPTEEKKSKKRKFIEWIEREPRLSIAEGIFEKLQGKISIQ